MSSDDPSRMRTGGPRPIDRKSDRELIAGRLEILTQAADASLSALAQRVAPRLIHDTRIAVRRLIVALRNLKHQLPARERRGCMKALLEMAGTCGELRDADVRQDLVQQTLASAGLEDHPQGHSLLAAAARGREAARQELQRRMNASRWNETLRNMRRHAAAFVVDRCRASGDGVIRELLAAQQRRLRRRLRKGTRSRKQHKLHRLRLRIKDARYFAEDFGPLIGAPIEDDVPRLRDLQQALGELHDAWRLGRWLKKQTQCHRVTHALRELLKTRRRKRLRRIRQLGETLLRSGGRG